MTSRACEAKTDNKLLRLQYASASPDVVSPEVSNSEPLCPEYLLWKGLSQDDPDQCV